VLIFKIYDPGYESRTNTIEGKPYKRVFGSVVVVAFQIAFRAEIHANDVFLFFKNHF